MYEGLKVFYLGVVEARKMWVCRIVSKSKRIKLGLSQSKEQKSGCVAVCTICTPDSIAPGLVV